MVKKVADYINKLADLNMSELKAMVESYRDHHNIQNYISSGFNQSQSALE